MEFPAAKETGLITLLSQILDTSIDGITLSDPDQDDNPSIDIFPEGCRRTQISGKYHN